MTSRFPNSPDISLKLFEEGEVKAKKFSANMQKSGGWSLVTLLSLIPVALFVIATFGMVIFLVVNIQKIESRQDQLKQEKTTEDLLNDVQLLNYALAAEDLEKAGYIAILETYASQMSQGTFTNSKGDVLSSPNLLAITQNIGGQEAAHSQALRETYIPYVCSLLPSPQKEACGPISPCTYDFGLQSQHLRAPQVNLTGIPLDSSEAFIDGFQLAELMERIGQAAYVEALSLLRIPEVRRIAAGILAAESEHTALYRFFLGTNPSPTTVVEGLSFNNVFCAAAPFVTNRDSCYPWSTRVCPT